MKTKKELLLSRRGGDWNWPGWRLAINVLSSKEERALDAEDSGGKAGVMSRVPTDSSLCYTRAPGSGLTRD